MKGEAAGFARGEAAGLQRHLAEVLEGRMMTFAVEDVDFVAGGSGILDAEIVLVAVFAGPLEGIAGELVVIGRGARLLG